MEPPLGKNLKFLCASLGGGMEDGKGGFDLLQMEKEGAHCLASVLGSVLCLSLQGCDGRTLHCLPCSGNLWIDRGLL